MKGPIQQYLSTIKKAQPGLVVHSIDFIDDGLVNDVVVINGETIFRFAKGENGIKALEAELRVLETIRPYVHLPVPNPFFSSQEMMAYSMLQGESLTRADLFALSETDRMGIMEQLAGFLRELHSVPLDKALPTTLAPVHYADWAAIYRRVEDEIYPLLMKHQRTWAEDLFQDMLSSEENFAYTPTIIHGDLACYHILFNPSSKQLNGIIDFGVAGIGDPANDFACLIQYYGEAFVRQFGAWNPAMDEPLMKRALFYAQAIEFEWILNGLERGEKFWFTAHIGNARGFEGLV